MMMKRWDRALMYRDSRLMAGSAKFLFLEIVIFSAVVGILKNSVVIGLITLIVLSVCVCIRMVSRFVGIAFTLLWFWTVYRLTLELTAMQDVSIVLGLLIAGIAGMLHYFAMQYSTTLFQK